MEHKLIRGKTIEEQIASIDKILKSFQNKLGKKVVGIIPPVVLSFEKRALDDDGRILASIIPFDGMLEIIAFHFGTMNTKSTVLDVEINHTDNTTVIHTVKAAQRYEVVVESIPVRVGDRLRIFGNGKEIGDVLVSVLIHASLNSMKRDVQIVERLRELEEEENALQNEQE
jgi:hypothetical protein